MVERRPPVDEPMMRATGEGVGQLRVDPAGWGDMCRRLAVRAFDTDAGYRVPEISTAHDALESSLPNWPHRQPPRFSTLDSRLS